MLEKLCIAGLLVTFALAAVAADQEIAGPAVKDPKIANWPWSLSYEGTVIAIKQKVYKQWAAKPVVYELTIKASAVPVPGDCSIYLNDDYQTVNLQVGTTFHQDFFATEQVYRDGDKASMDKVANGDRVRWWCCPSAAPLAPGWLLEVNAPPKKQ